MEFWAIGQAVMSKSRADTGMRMVLRVVGGAMSPSCELTRGQNGALVGREAYQGDGGLQGNVAAPMRGVSSGCGGIDWPRDLGRSGPIAGAYLADRTSTRSGGTGQMSRTHWLKFQQTT